MRNQKTMREFLITAAGTATAILVAIAINMVASGQTLANQVIAKKTGEACAKCHTAPPALNDYGKKYKANGK